MATSRPRTWTAEQDKALLELHAQGLSLTNVAVELGKSRTAVQRRAKALGLTWSGRAQMAAAIASHQERAAERQARVDAQLAYANGKVAERLVELVEFLELEEGFFYLKGRGGEMVKVKRGADSPLPLEYYESVVNLVNNTFMTSAKVKNLTKIDGAIDEVQDSLLRSAAENIRSVEIDPEVWRENEEVPPSE